MAYRLLTNAEQERLDAAHLPESFRDVLREFVHRTVVVDKSDERRNTMFTNKALEATL